MIFQLLPLLHVAEIPVELMLNVPRSEIMLFVRAYQDIMEILKSIASPSVLQVAIARPLRLA